MRILVGFLLATLTACVPARPQEPAIEPVRRAEVPADSVHQLEPHLVRTTDGLLVTAHIEFTPDPEPETGFMALPGSFTCAARLSPDSGRSWVPLRLPFGAPCGDPWLAPHPDGGVVMVVSGAGIGAMAGVRVLTWTRDGGWRLVYEGERDLDHPTAVVDGDAVLVTGSPLSGRPVFIRLEPTSGLVKEVSFGFPNRARQHVDAPVITADGEIVVPLTDFRAVWVARSVDGGRSFTPPVKVSDDCRGPFNHAMSDGARLYFACVSVSGNVHLYESLDGGHTWSGKWRAPGTRHGTPTLVSSAGSGSSLVWQVNLTNGCPALMTVMIDEQLENAVPKELARSESCDPEMEDYPGRRFPWGGDYIGLTAVQRDLVVAWPIRQGTHYRVHFVFGRGR